MPQQDSCHEQVVRALEKEGWRIKPTQEQRYTPDRTVFIDIVATRGVNGSTQQVLLVEVKCFTDRNSTTRELYIAFGQYILYRALLAELRDETPLYLAVPEDAYSLIFEQTAMRAVRDNHVKMVIVNVVTETITQWIE
jgi:hypothetical protein